jgi:hypothetical protein
MFRKGLAVAVILLFIGVAFASSINANVTKASDKSQEIKTSNSAPQLGWELRGGFRYPGINIYVENGGNETFRGNISCKFTINATIMICGNSSINISDFYVEIEPLEQVLLYRGLILGFGSVEAVLDMSPPLNIYEEFEGFLLFIFLFLKFIFQ